MTTGTMNTGNTFARKFVRVTGLAVLAFGLFAGGCNKALKEENAQLQRENMELRDRNAQCESMLAQVQGGGTSGQNNSNYQATERVIEIAGDVLFDAGKATLKSTAKKELDRVVATIKSTHSGRTVKVVGHTDSDPIKKSKWPSNEALSEARAEAVAAYLADKGISRSSITVFGKGATEPKNTKAASRRVEVVIVDMQ